MKELYYKYRKFLPAGFFIGGFLFDLLTTGRIDHSFSLVQQAAYLLLVTIFIYWEIVPLAAFKQEDSFLGKLWKFHVEVLHFLFGSLLSLYTIFYFKSASLVNSFIFMFFMAGLLVVNELPQLQKRGMFVRSALFSLCLISYLIYLVPVVIGAIGLYAFLLAMVCGSSLYYLIGTRILRKTQNKPWLIKNYILPGIAVQVVFLILYFTKVLPPVPISLKYIGIYHQVEKADDEYVLKFERPWWRIWQAGAQTYIMREGDKVYCFVSIFAPTQFTDQLTLEWYQSTQKGWNKVDSIPIEIFGGRAQGFRGYAYKSNFQPGDWQVRVLTSDDREVGRISFDVVPAAPDSQREWQTDTY